MATNPLRIRFLSFDDAEKQSPLFVVLYVKKLEPVPTPAAKLLSLREDQSKSPVVLSCPDALDLADDDEYVQVLFISPDSKQVLADLLLQRTALVDQCLTDPRYERSVRLELLRSTLLAEKYTLRFTIRLLEAGVNGMRLFRNHALKTEQFNHPVFCALCHKFIWGLLRQGYRCTQCALVMHRRCYSMTPFDCLNARALPVLPRDDHYQQDYPVVEHRFQSLCWPVLQTVANGGKAYCNHCGSPVLQNALECLDCQMFIHQQCVSNVPPMCAKLLPAPTDERVPSVASAPTPPPARPSTRPSFAHFECFAQLGSGRYGHVYGVKHLPSGKYMAVKVVDGSDREACEQFPSEKHILLDCHLDNPYILRGYCSFHCGSNLFLAMEFVEGVTLRETIRKRRMNDIDCRFYLAELISAIQYLHSKQIIHRDVKLDNVLVDNNGHIRLVDYGLASVLQHPEERRDTICGTPSYFAPEMQRLEKNDEADGYGYSVDYWALGMVFGQMLAGGQDEFDFQLFLHPGGEFDRLIIDHAIAGLPSEIFSVTRDCLRGLLDLDPHTRLGSPDSPRGALREHAFFRLHTAVDWDLVDKASAKPAYRCASMWSSMSTKTPFASLSCDRSPVALQRWMTAGQARCASADEDEQWSSFDAVHHSNWSKLT